MKDNSHLETGNKTANDEDYRASYVCSPLQGDPWKRVWVFGAACEGASRCGEHARSVATFHNEANSEHYSFILLPLRQQRERARESEPVLCSQRLTLW